MSVLVVAEHLRGQVRDVTRELITAGRELGPVTVAVIGQDPASLVDSVNVDGVAEIVTVTIAAGEFENDAYQAAVEALIADRKPRVTLLGFTVNSMGYGPAAAVKLGLGFASDVHGVALEGDAVIATRSFYGSKVSAELEFPGAEGVMLLLRPTVWAPAEGVGQRVGDLVRGGRCAVACPAPRARRGDRLVRRRHHAGGLPALDRPRHRRQGKRRDVQGARREDGRDALGLAPPRRRGLDALLAPGRPVGQDREADASTSHSGSPVRFSTSRE